MDISLKNRIHFIVGRDAKKGWGKEVLIANNVVEPGEDFPTGYSGKLLVYDKQGALSSMHFHGKKHETFYVLKGRFDFWWIRPESAEKYHTVLLEGSGVIIPPLNNHQLSLLSDEGIIIEFASSDYPWDSYRVSPGDSQNKK